MFLYALGLERSSDGGACFLCVWKLKYLGVQYSFYPHEKKRLSHYDLAT